MSSIDAELRAGADPERAGRERAYLKAVPGGYGGEDSFLGLSVPFVRTVAKKYAMLPFGDIERLLESQVHEFRLCALEILVLRYDKEPDMRERVFSFVLEHKARANNWDLIDGSVSYIIGQHLLTARTRKVLYEYARSANLWDRRIAIVSTLEFIRAGQYADTLAIAEILLHDDEDLIHKASGWMLREVGKKSKQALEVFLRVHAHTMPRTTLRYAIEKFPAQQRKAWMALGKTKKARDERTATLTGTQEKRERTEQRTEPFSHRTSALFERVKRQQKR